MLQFLIDNMFGGRVFQQTFGISIGTKCTHLLADLLFYSDEADFIQGFPKQKQKEAIPIL